MVHNHASVSFNLFILEYWDQTQGPGHARQVPLNYTPVLLFQKETADSIGNEKSVIPIFKF